MHLLLFIVLFFPITLSAQKFISKEKALADIDSLHSIIKQVHYNPYLHITEEDFLTRINEVKKNIGDSIELKSFLKQLYFLVYAMEDSHTGPAIVQQELRPELAKPIFAPFYFIADEKTNVYVSNDNPLIQKGSRIISVNGKNTSDLFREATTLWGGNKEFSFDMAERFLSYYFFLSGIQAPFVFEYEREGKKNTIEIKEGVNFSKALSLTLPQMVRKAFSFKVIENKIALINSSHSWILP